MSVSRTKHFLILVNLNVYAVANYLNTFKFCRVQCMFSVYEYFLHEILQFL